jgi:hypothetical protein
MLTIFNFVLVAANTYFLFKIWRACEKVAEDTRKKEELNASVVRFAQLFAEAQPIPKPKKLPVVQYD